MFNQSKSSSILYFFLLGFSQGKENLSFCKSSHILHILETGQQETTWKVF